MILGTKARYAVMAMVDLASCDGAKPVKLATIATRQEIPLAYLEQIFGKLRARGLVRSVKGPGGGYLLMRGASEISISDIVVAAEESMKMTRCESQEKGGCMATKARCLTHDLWEGLSAQIYDYFRAVSLEDVCRRKLKRGNTIHSGHLIEATRLI